LTPPLVLGLDAAFLALDAAFLTLDTYSVLVLDPMDTFLALDPLLSLDATFLSLDADPVLGIDPVPAFLTLDPVPFLSRPLPFLGEFTNHLFLGMFVAWVLSPFY
jgi:hypothetical protein